MAYFGVFAFLFCFCVAGFCCLVFCFVAFSFVVLWLSPLLFFCGGGVFDWFCFVVEIGSLYISLAVL